MGAVSATSFTFDKLRNSKKSKQVPRNLIWKKSAMRSQNFPYSFCLFSQEEHLFESTMSKFELLSLFLTISVGNGRE